MGLNPAGLSSDDMLRFLPDVLGRPLPMGAPLSGIPLVLGLVSNAESKLHAWHSKRYHWFVMVSTPSRTVVAKKRVRCPVCQRRSHSDWMGDILYPEDSPETWEWYKKPKAGVSGAGPSVASDPANPAGVVYRHGFHKTGEWSLFASWEDGEMRPRCFDGHKLAILDPATMTDLLRKADKVGRDWITIPE